MIHYVEGLAVSFWYLSSVVKCLSLQYSRPSPLLDEIHQYFLFSSLNSGIYFVCVVIHIFFCYWFSCVLFQFFYYVNDGTYGSLNTVLTEHAILKPELIFGKEEGALFHSTIWGPTCDSIDCITHTAFLPELHIGEWILFRVCCSRICMPVEVF